MRHTWLASPEHLELLSSPLWNQCEERIRAFEAGWQAGSPPNLDDYLWAEGAVRLALLGELVHVDLEFRAKAGEEVRVEDYLARFPELTASSPALGDLILAEFELRRRVGRALSVLEYQQRFPQLATELLARLELIAGETRVPSSWAAAHSAGVWPEAPGYTLVEQIGRGGMGIVYKAWEPHLGRHVALKFLPEEYAQDPSRLDRFVREARTASALNHPHICTVHALGEHGGRHFIALEFVEGQTLEALGARRPLPGEVLPLLVQVARALAAAHAAGVVHRDVKPENVMVRDDGFVKVLDFGLARQLPSLLGPPGSDSGATEVGALIGTVAYMSPEQVRGEAVDGASDVFSLGIVGYRLLTGQHPFAADTRLGMLHAIASRQPLRASRLRSEIPAPLEALLEGMLHKDPRRRPTAAEVEAACQTLRQRPPATAASASASARPVVPRAAELQVLRTAWNECQSGHGSLVCVSGEPGIGKTTLVTSFLDELSQLGSPPTIGSGHCSERLAGAEAYWPVLDALRDLLSSAHSDTIARLLPVAAPSWQAELGATLGPPPALTKAASQAGLLRELGELVEEVCRLGPLVVFLDDVHWADVSTIDLLSLLARRGRDLRLLIVVTYRPTELLLGPHAFHAVKLELQARGACRELPVAFFDRGQVERYLAAAYPEHAFPVDLAQVLLERTEGSPLFVADLLRDLEQRAVIAQSDGAWRLQQALPQFGGDLPESVRGMVERKLARLSASDRRLLAAASVEGREFHDAVLARALEREPAAIEERLQALDRVHGLVRRVRETEFLAGPVAQRYEFVHALYQQALFAELVPSRRAALALAIGRALEKFSGSEAPSLAAELACLYEVGREPKRAARQFQAAAQNAARVFAHREAVALAERGISLLANLSAGRRRDALELELQMTLGMQLQVTEGYACPAAGQAYERARSLQPNESTPFAVLWGLWLFHKVRSELAKAQRMAEELLALARAQNDPDLALQAHQALGITALCRGAPPEALRHVEQAAVLYDRQRHQQHAHRFGQDPGVICKAFGAVELLLMGDPEAGLCESQSALDLSRGLSPSSRAIALHFAAMLHQLRRDPDRTLHFAECSAALSREHGLSFWLAGSGVLAGWAQVALGQQQAGLERLQQGLRDWNATGSVTYLTYFLGLEAETLLDLEQPKEAVASLSAALQLAERTGEGLYLPELLRLKGEAAQRLGESSAGADFEHAWQAAREQEARLFELRAACALARMSNVTARDTYCDRLGVAIAAFPRGCHLPDVLAGQEALAGLA